MLTLLAVALGGAVGATARYGAGRLLASLGLGSLGPFTLLATFVVNTSGALALGFLIGVAEERTVMSPVLRTALLSGVLGSYTTFSTLMYEIVEQAERGQMVQAGLSLTGSIAFGVGAVVLGLMAGRAVARGAA